VHAGGLILGLTLSAHGDGAAMFIRAGMRHALLTEWLEHADPESALDYAHADTEMKCQAFKKADIATTHNPRPTPLWHGREGIIQCLSGLKD